MTPQASTAFNTASNRLSSGLYDAAGNLTSDAAGSAFVYDAENKLARSTVGGVVCDYGYDGEGRRVKKVVGGATTIFVYDALGRLIADYRSGAASGGGTRYLFTDHLGSVRLVTDQNGVVKGRHDYLPYGEELGAGIGGRSTAQGYSQADGLRQKFTGYEHDDESGLDFAQARYYSSAQGRFTSVDPLLESARRGLPQSWNRYVYAWNNPLRFIDPDGKEVKVLDKKALEYIRSTLPKEIRDKIKLDKNGLIDKKALNKIKSKDANFLDLKALVNSSSVLEVATAKGVAGQPEFVYKSVEQLRKEVTEKLIKEGDDPKDAAEAANLIDQPTNFTGSTIAPNETDSGNARVVVADGTGATATAPMVELVVTMGHELYAHGRPLIEGRPWKHDNGGPVDANMRKVEDRTRRNFEGSSGPKPKKP